MDNVNRATAGERIFQTLRSRILGLDLLPGRHLTEIAIAKEFGVSATPVREALHRLVEVGLAKRETARGVTVCELTEDDIRNVFELRALLEPVAVRTGIPWFGESDWAALQALLEKGEDAAQRGQLLDLSRFNEGFHRQLVAKSRNTDLVVILNGLIDRHRLVSMHFCTTYRLWMEDWQDHREIFVRARQGDAEGAAALLGNHIQRFGELTMAAYRETRSGSGLGWARSGTGADPSPGE